MREFLGIFLKAGNVGWKLITWIFFSMSGEWSTFVPGSNGDVAAVPMSPDGKSDTASTRTQSVTTRITKKKINKTNAVRKGRRLEGLN